MGARLIAMLLRLIGLGAILAAVSEVWFYPVEMGTHLIGLCLIYGVIAYTVWLMMAQSCVRTWAGAFFGACAFGFMIEGIPVPVLYEALPFTLLWTSIAWHAIVSVGLGLWGFRILIARATVLRQILVFACSGAYLGIWSVQMWSLREDGGPWVWTSTDAFAQQVLIGWAIFVAGHMMLDRAARTTVVPLKWEWIVFSGIVATFFGVGTLINVFPLSLVLPVVVTIALWLMLRDGRKTQSPSAPFLVRLSGLQGTVFGYGLSAIVPLMAIAVYDGLARADLQLDSSAIHILWAGPASLILVMWAATRIIKDNS